MKREIVKPDGESSQTSHPLLERAKAHDAEAWTRLVETYGRRIYAWARVEGLQPADAADVSQEVLKSVAAKLDGFCDDHRNATFRGWLRRITQRKVIDHMRQKTKWVDLPAGGTDAHDQLNALAAQAEPSTGSTRIRSLSQGNPAWLARIQTGIGDRDWKIFWRLVVDEQTTAQVAEEFDMTPNSVRIVKMRVLRRLNQNASVAQEPIPTCDGPGTPGLSPKEGPAGAEPLSDVR